MRKRNIVRWFAFVAGGCALAAFSCCCFTGLVGAFAPSDEPQRVAMDSAPPPRAIAMVEERDLCSSGEPMEMPPFAREARVELAVIVGADRRPRLRIRHNLPPRTVIAADVSEGDVAGATLLATDGRYNANAELELDAACVVAGPFPPLPAGRYTAMVSTPAFAQPADVERLFGVDHRHLHGPQVRVVMGVRIVEATERFEVIPE